MRPRAKDVHSAQDRMEGSAPLRARFDRAPRRTVRRLPSEGFALALALTRDARFLSLRSSTQAAILFAVLRYADARGWFWPKVETWATEWGRSRSTAERAIREAEQAGLLVRAPYLRPDGTQGSTTYKLDPALVTSSVTPDGPPAFTVTTRRAVTGEAPSRPTPIPEASLADDARTGSAARDGRTGSVTSESPEQVRERFLEREGSPLNSRQRQDTNDPPHYDYCLRCQRRCRNDELSADGVCGDCDAARVVAPGSPQ